MRKTNVLRMSSLATVLGVMLGCWPALSSMAQGAQPGSDKELQAEFLKLSDVACKKVTQEKITRAFYVDSYAIRALAVAYDMTGKKEYLDACNAWSDRMLKHQKTMIPKGAYYMNYGRKPDEDRGEWYSADASCIGLAVLATAVRCTDAADKDRYIKSVESFAKLVIENYVGPSGGITDGLWSRFDGEWYCSSGIFGSLAFLLYGETDKKEYLEVALNDLDWLNQLDFQKTKYIGFNVAAPAVVMYTFEGYTPAMQYLKAGTERQQAALAQIAKATQWMAKNQAGRQPEGQRQLKDKKWRSYNHQWGSKFGGLPFLMYVFSRHVPEPEGRQLRAAADQELHYLSSLLFEHKGSADLKLKMTTTFQLKAFCMMSYAEKLSPGALFRKSNP